MGVPGLASERAGAWSFEHRSELAVKEIFLVGTILSLLLVGLALALRSGGVQLTTARGLRQFATNLLVLLLRLFGYATGLILLHKVIGSPSPFSW